MTPDARRREDWPERLLAFARSRERQPFVWGTNDCALFAADAALAMTGHDFAAPFRGLLGTAQSFIDPSQLIQNSIGDQMQATMKSKMNESLAVQPAESDNMPNRERK